MKYSVVYTERSFRQLSKLDKPTQVLIHSWIKKRLDGSENPRAFGKALSANRTGEWRYRIGDYRLIVEIKDTEVVILVLEIAHRSIVYKSK